jgi:hypothetical protein
MKKLTLLFIALIFSSSTFAFSWDSKAETRNLTAGISDSREGAYNLGHNFASNIQKESPNKLKRTLGIYEYGLETNSIKVENSHVEVDEISTAKGQVKYRAMVNINYSYDVSGPNSH